MGGRASEGDAEGGRPVPVMARTISQIFDAWKSNPCTPSEKWRGHWSHLWADQLRAYLARGWRLIRIEPHGKGPALGIGTSWTEDRPTFDELLAWAVGKRGNIAVVSEGSGVVILDYDHKENPPSVPDALRISTPNGFAYVMNSEARAKRISKRVPGFDHLRTGVMYELLPLSQTRDKNGILQVREWD